MKYAVNDRVKFVKTASELDGKTGRVFGFHGAYVAISGHDAPQFCIVLLDEPLSDRPDHAIVIISSCLELADDPKVASRDVHTRLIKEYALKDDPTSHHAIRKMLDRLAGVRFP